MTYPPGYTSTVAPLSDEPDNRTNVRKPASLSEKNVRPANRTNTGQTPALALEKDILGRFKADLRRAGVAGEERLASITYLVVTSRVLPWGKSTERPVSMLAKGTTSTGKSHTTRMTLRFFPASAYVDLGSMSKKFLFYDEESYAHRFIVVPEWAQIAEDDEIIALLRTLLSEGRIIHGTVDGEGKRRARRIEKEGPTGLLVTTTKGFVDPEMETRCLSLTTDDTPEQTRRVFGVYADLEDDDGGGGVDFGPWHDFQIWIAEEGENRVYVPFIRELSELMPTGATRLRRDFVSLVCLVRAHTILCQAQRERDSRGRIIATIEGDYEPVRELVGDVIAHGVEASVPHTVRETVETVRSLIDNGDEHPSAKVIADFLGIGRSATYDRISECLRRGHLVNEADRTERGMKLALGAELPAGSEDFLPSAAAIVRCSSGRPTGRSFGSTMRPDSALSGCPVRPKEARLSLPIFGDEMYPVVLAAAVKNGQVTIEEANEAYAVHQAVERNRGALPVPGDERFPVMLAERADAGHITALEFEERLALHSVLSASRNGGRTEFEGEAS